VTFPGVSVAIPLFQPSPQHLRDALAGLRDQELSPREIIITDDSPQPNAALVTELAAGLPYSYYHHPNALGMVCNWNDAVLRTSLSHVVLLHQDDVLESPALGHMYGVFLRNPDLAVCGVGETRIDGSGRPIGLPRRTNHREHLFIRFGEHRLSYRELTYLMVRNGQIFGEPSALMFSRRHFDVVGGFDDSFRHSVDIDFALRMCRSGGAVYSTDRLVRRRCHGGQATWRNIADGHSLRERAALFERHVRNADFEARELDRIRANLVVRAAYDGVRAARGRRWSLTRQALRQCVDFRSSVGALGARVVELGLRMNRDAR
jgi:GT2 family glycosyltransferase